MRQDLTHIQRWIAPGSRVLDLGCGNGEFLELLRDQRGVDGTGLEIDAESALERVLDTAFEVFQPDRGAIFLLDPGTDRIASQREIQIRRLDYKRDSLQDIFLRAMEGNHGGV